MNQILRTGSRNDKERLLAQADKATQKAIEYALDPFRTYGVTLKKAQVAKVMSNRSGATAAGHWWTAFYRLLDQLAARDLTGSAATTTLLEHFAICPTPDDADWALRVLHKKLRCGVSVTTALKVFPGLVTPFEVALANAWSGDRMAGVGYLEPKLDGMRVTVVDGVPLSRKGNHVNATDAMLDELASLIGRRNARLRDWVFDGEFIGAGTFEETISKARSSGGENRGLVFNVFDMVARDEWRSRQTRPFSDRRRDIERHIAKGGQLVQRVESIRVEDATASDIHAACARWMADGFEGAMYKADVPYEFRRSDAVLKVKKWDTLDAPIVGAEEGKRGGRNEGRLGALIIQLDDGTRVNVGGGLSDAQREDFWTRRQALVGRTIEVQYQNFTTKGSLRHPQFVRFRDDK
jgi:DNA ligase-1